MDRSIQIGHLNIQDQGPFFVIAGPCVIENEETTLKVSQFIRETADLLNIPIIFKSSFDKANRTSLDSFRGPGIDKGLEIMEKVKEIVGLKVLSDIHETGQVKKAAQVLDVIQIPAFLCRQTDLLVAVAKTGLPVNVKKGQFMSPWEMEQVIRKVTSNGNQNLMVTERGASFGYNNLVFDIRSIPIMKAFGFPVIFDATHSVQLPGGSGSCSGGQRDFVPYLAKAAVAAGANGVFMEIHPNPEDALCDGPNSLSLEAFRPLLSVLKEIHGLIRSKA
jgi:2-dehydro-3-deoxyphosphooctonate aldolase (KDO 8-P synthase)